MKTFGLTLIFLLFVSTNLFAQQPGALDSTFGTNGLVSTDINATWLDHLYAVDLQSDGKIVAAGKVIIDTSDTNWHTVVVRYNTNGTLDNTFGTNGYVLEDIFEYVDFLQAITIQPDGKIIVAGTTFNSNNLKNTFLVLRYHSDGSRDHSFGINGMVTTSIGSTAFATSIALRNDGKIFVGGYSYSGSESQFSLACYHVNGQLDSSFNGDGILINDIGPGHDAICAITIQPDSKIIAAGSSNNSFAIVRYNADGSMDASFGEDGIVVTTFNSASEVRAIGLQNDGKIIATGGANFNIARYNTNGTLDNSFSNDGKNTVIINNGEATSARVQLNGKIAVAGHSKNGPYWNYTLVLFNSNGTLDNSFGSNGSVILNESADHQVCGMVLQPDKKIVIAGVSNASFGLARFLTSLSIGIPEFSLSANTPLIYPNPVAQDATLEYILAQQEEITITLTDIQGKLLSIFLDRQKQEEGTYKQAFSLPEALPSGTYLLTISNGKGRATIKITH